MKCKKTISIITPEELKVVQEDPMKIAKKY